MNYSNYLIITQINDEIIQINVEITPINDEMITMNGWMNNMNKKRFKLKIKWLKWMISCLNNLNWLLNY